MDIKAEDCRLEGFDGGRNARFNKGTHLPSGTVVEFQNLLSKREVMKALEKAVNELHADKQALSGRQHGKS